MSLCTDCALHHGDKSTFLETSIAQVGGDFTECIREPNTAHFEYAGKQSTLSSL